MFLNCSDVKNKTKTNDMTMIEISYEGEIDKPLPKMVFCEDCKAYSSFESYSFDLNDAFFEKMENCFLSLKEKSKERENNTVLSVKINSQKTSFFLTAKEAKTVIQEIMKQSSYKKNNVLESQLKRYYTIINK